MSKQVRINNELHKTLKVAAAQENTTIMRLLEIICEAFFKNKNPEAPKE